MTPFRMQVLMDVAARVVKLMVTGVWHLSFEEMDMVLALVRHGIDESNERNRKGVFDYPDPYEQWKAAKDFAVVAPVMLFAWPHEYIVCQKHSDLRFVVADRSLSDRVISRSELDTTVEVMPTRPSFLAGVLYWKNETTIYWVHTESPGNKALEVLFPRLNGISFFEDDWIADNAGQEDEEPADGREEAAEDSLPY